MGPVAAASVEARLEHGERWLAIAAVVLPALTAALVLVPQLATRGVTASPEQIGQPVTENLKAPFDLTVIDPEVTARMRDEAAARVPRVFDHDTGAARLLGERLAAARRVLASTSANEADSSEQHARAVQALGVEARASEVRALHLHPEESKRWADILSELAAMPIVAAGQLSAIDAQHGVAIHRVPATPGQPDTELRADDLRDLQAVRGELRRRVDVELTQLPAGPRGHLSELGQRMLAPNLTPNRAATELARELAKLAIAPVTLAVKKGEMIIRDGERLTPRHLLLVESVARSRRGSHLALSSAGAAALVALLILAATAFNRDATRRVRVGVRDQVFLSVLFSCTLLAARVWVLVAGVLHERFGALPERGLVYLFPIAVAVLLARLVLSVRVALVFGVLTSLALGLVFEPDSAASIFGVVGTIVGAAALRTLSSRSDLLRAGLVVGLAQAGVGVAVELFQAQTSAEVYLATVGLALAGGVGASVLVLGLTPVVEAAFGYTTALRLLELANMNHPALRELIVRAPGSYHHSVIVGSLAEAAAESIGANPLLARVMSYFHDIGKGLNPGYFIENQREGHNPHDKLKASMSAMIIKRHVTDGLELARKYRLGEQIMAAIAEHHGTTLIHYFYRRAKDHELPEDPVHENDFRYPGRKPQSRETAIVMLADAVEAASRSLAEPTSARLHGLVTRVINTKFTDGQLEECDLTLRDLHFIARAFCRVLDSIFHQRVEYPQAPRDLENSSHAHPDPQSSRRSQLVYPGAASDRPDDLRRLGLS